MFIARQTGVLGHHPDRGLFPAGSNEESMPEVSVSIDIPAPPETVWLVLTDTEAYPQWNTLLSVRGDFTVGETVAVRLSIPGLPAVPIAPEITAFEPEKALRWRSQLFGIEADHAFLLEPLADGGTRFVQSEQFSGAMAGPVVRRFERRIRRGFEQMNVGLRRRAVELVDETAQ